MNFIRKKPQRPDFWLQYIDSFNDPTPRDIPSNRFVVFDTETTGLNPKKDRILSMGLLSVRDHKIRLREAVELFVFHKEYHSKSIGIHEIRKFGDKERMSEAEAIKCFLQYIGNAILVGHHIHFDCLMINQALKRMNLPRIKNKMLDTKDLFLKTKIINPLIQTKLHYSLDELCEELTLTIENRHTALGDAYITAIIFLKIVYRLRKNNETLQISDLFYNKLLNYFRFYS